MPRVEINVDECAGCGICVDICPVRIFGMDDDRASVTGDMNECTACRECETNCPTAAITIID